MHSNSWIKLRGKDGQYLNPAGRDTPGHVFNIVLNFCDETPCLFGEGL